MPTTPLLDRVPSTTTHSLLPSATSLLLVRGQSKEQCPKCCEFFDIVELISHVDSCVSDPTDTTAGGEEDHCQFCLKLFPVISLVSHATECSERRETAKATRVSTLNFCIGFHS